MKDYEEDDAKQHPIATVVCQCCGRIIAYHSQKVCPFSGKPLKIKSYQAIERKKPLVYVDLTDLMGS